MNTAPFRGSDIKCHRRIWLSCANPWAGSITVTRSRGFSPHSVLAKSLFSLALEHSDTYYIFLPLYYRLGGLSIPFRTVGDCRRDGNVVLQQGFCQLLGEHLHRNLPSSDRVGARGEEATMNIKAITQLNEVFKAAGFDYAICGGFALDMFVNREIRDHGDLDVMVFREDKHRAIQFLMNSGWLVFGRFAEHGAVWQYLFYKVADITDGFWDGCTNYWAIKPEYLPQVLQKIDRLPGEVYTYQARKWLVQREIEFIELELDSRNQGDYIARENPRVARPLAKAILYRDGIPYLAPEVILFFKTDRYSSESAYAKPRTEADFKALMPVLSEESKQWLLGAIAMTYPEGHAWLDWLGLQL